MALPVTPTDSYSVLDVAAKYGVHPETVRRWAREKRIPAQKIGNMIFISPEDLENLITKKERKNG